MLKEILLPVKGLKIGRGKVLLHHTFAMAIAEVHLLNLLHDEVIMHLLEALDRE